MSEEEFRQIAEEICDRRIQQHEAEFNRYGVWFMGIFSFVLCIIGSFIWRALNQ